MKTILWTCLLSVIVPGVLAGEQGAASTEDQRAFFERRIRPVLVEHCYECHSVESGKSKGGLLLDTRSGIRAGGDGGPAVVPGDPAASLLLAAMRHSDPDLAMPPQKERLPSGVIADIETWIRQGAHDPRVAEIEPAKSPYIDLEKGRDFWSYRPPADAATPQRTDAKWARRDLDQFVLAKLDGEGLVPSPDAPAGVLLRRLHLDLTGLPPSPEEVGEFESLWKSHPEEQDNLLARTADKLLAAPAYGERWGRHWLDVVRFAESNGRESNLTFPHAWRYRDYVIDAFNADVPFDRFITEQIAGDLLPAANEAERARLLIATGFLAMGAKGLNEMSKAQFAADLVDEQIDTVSRAVMASSLACARCHDHKSEPFRMEDYYAMAGIFRSTRTLYGTWIDSENNNGSKLVRLPDLPGQVTPGRPLSRVEVEKLKSDLAALNREEAEQKALAEKAKAEGVDLSKDFFKILQTALRIYWSRGGLEGRLETVDDDGRRLPLCMGVEEGARVEDAPLLERGEPGRPGNTIARRFPEVINIPGVAQPPDDESGRLELAQWLTHREHPLTARVMANRVWRHLFGTGLVRTVDNFGFSGELPTHPELLDHLALKFMDKGWSVKQLVREVVLSRTYRQASGYREDAYAQDPDNRLLWRMSKRRLDAEAIRDAMLVASGQLDGRRRAGSLVAEIEGQSVSLIGFNPKIPADLDGSRHRSVYLPVLRDHLPDALQLFDFAEPSLVTGSRDVTNVPLQALYLLNGKFVEEQAAGLAKRLLAEAKDDGARVTRAFALCFQRQPTEQELRLAVEFLQSVRLDSEDEARSQSQSFALNLFCQSLLAAAEFRNVD